MNAIRIALHGLALTVTNIAGIIVGFVAYNALGAKDQISTQLPIGVLFSILLFIAWTLLIRNLPFRRLELSNSKEFTLAFLCSLVWNPIVFVPLHYLTQGYRTSVGNILALFFFQLPVNAFAVIVAWRIGNLEKTRSTEPGR